MAVPGRIVGPARKWPAGWLHTRRSRGPKLLESLRTMSTVSAPRLRASASPSPVRHGARRLTLTIGRTDYGIRPVATPPAGYRSVWTLRKQDPASSAAYDDEKCHDPACTRPDHEHN